MARVINEQKEVIEKYQELIKLPKQIKKKSKISYKNKLNKLKGEHPNIWIE